jgi:hypothetical protein
VGPTTGPARQTGIVSVAWLSLRVYVSSSKATLMSPSSSTIRKDALEGDVRAPPWGLENTMVKASTTASISASLWIVNGTGASPLGQSDDGTSHTFGVRPWVRL